MIPTDFHSSHALAIILLLASWFGYSSVLKKFGTGSLNWRLGVVRHQWVSQMSLHTSEPFNAILLGHIINSVAFFGSATLIVLAGIFSTLAHVETLHRTVTGLYFVRGVSLELFTLEYTLLAGILTLSFFSFTYALRKLVYAIAMIGALPARNEIDQACDELVSSTTTVLTEALITFNFGIRGYYYAVATIFLFASPWACIVVTLIVSAILLYRQLRSKTSIAISHYIGTSNQMGS